MKNPLRKFGVFLSASLVGLSISFYSAHTDALTIAEYDSKEQIKRGQIIANTVQKIVSYYESKEEKKQTAICTRRLYDTNNVFGIPGLYSLILLRLNLAREVDPEEYEVEDIIFGVTERACSYEEAARDVRGDVFTDECGTEDAVYKLLTGEKGYEVAAQFERHVGRGKGDERYMLSSLLIHPKTKEWLYIYSNRPRGYDAKNELQVLCVKAIGTNMTTKDYKNTKTVYENIVTLEIDGKPKEIKQGELHEVTIEYTREQWDKLHELGGRPDKGSKDPYIIEVLGHRIDFRDETTACQKATERWKRKSCKTYEEMKKYWNNRGGFIAFQGIGKDRNEEDYIVSIVVKDDEKVYVLNTTLDGGTVIRRRGRDLQITQKPEIAKAQPLEQRQIPRTRPQELSRRSEAPDRQSSVIASRTQSVPRRPPARQRKAKSRDHSPAIVVARKDSTSEKVKPLSKPAKHLNETAKAGAAPPSGTLEKCTADVIAGSYQTSYGTLKCKAKGSDLDCCYNYSSGKCHKMVKLTVVPEKSLVTGKWVYSSGSSGAAEFGLTEDCALTDGRWGYAKPTAAWRVMGRQ